MTDIYESLNVFTPPFIDSLRYEAFCAMLNAPDPPDLPPRRTVLKWPGKPDRFKKWLTILMLATRERVVSSHQRTWWETAE
jgi:hypothetical protein